MSDVGLPVSGLCELTHRRLLQWPRRPAIFSAFADGCNDADPNLQWPPRPVTLSATNNAPAERRLKDMTAMFQDLADKGFLRT